MGKLSERQLAAKLGISHTMISKYRRRGMPTNSEAAARRWLRDNSVGRFAEKDHATTPPEGVETIVESPVNRQPRKADGSTEKGSTSADEFKGLSQADLTKRLTGARIKLTERDAAVRALQVRQDQMDADLRDGRLLVAEHEHRKGHERALTLRNKLLGLPAECAVQLAAITDAAMVADFLRKRIKAALIEYCASYGVYPSE